MTVLANAPRSRALFAFTSRARTRFVAVRVETPADADAARDVFEDAVSVTDADLDVALGTSGGSCLSGTAAAILLAEIRKRSPAASGRIYLFDSSGGSVALEGTRVASPRQGDRPRGRPRVALVHVSRGHAWHAGPERPPLSTRRPGHVRAPTELVLVCPIPAELRPGASVDLRTLRPRVSSASRSTGSS